MIAKFHQPSIHVNVSAESMTTSTGTPVARELVERDPYEGTYEVTPSAEVQALSTKNLRMTDDVVIAAIPNNYGLITWNGSTLTVS